MNSSITYFAKTNFRNQFVPFGIKTDDRRRHMYVIGKTGMGKTNLLENIVVQDIRNGHGVAYIDPHGDTAEKLLHFIPPKRINDVVYFNPADTEYPVAFNILEAVEEDKKHLVASGMMGVFKKIWPDVWSPRMEYILNNAILALLDYPGSTMLGVNRMMSDKEYRKRVYPKIKDPVVKSFWVNEFDKWEDRFRKEAVAAIQNKVGQFLSSFMIRNIVGQTKSTIDMRQIMDNRKILIANLSKGKIGEDAMRLLGGMLVTKIQLAAMERINIPEEERKDFYLCVDEFQNFVTESFANILSEARKYRLNLIVAHQYINQLVSDDNTTVRDAVFGNVGTIISFRVGAEDAEFLEKEFFPIFTANDLVNLPKYTIYLKLMIDGVAGDAFSATTLPPIEIKAGEENSADKVIKVSRERYTKSKKEVEEKIARWIGMDIDGGDKRNFVEEKTLANRVSQPISSLASTKTLLIQKKKEEVILPSAGTEIKKPENEERLVEDKKMYDAVCDTCGVEIKIPFQPDGKRPVFCKDCLKDYQRSVMRRNSYAVKNSRQSKQDAITGKKVQAIKDKEQPASIQTEIKTYFSSENPLKLSQIQHIAPKKFKPLQKKPIDFEKVRSLLKKNRDLE